MKHKIRKLKKRGVVNTPPSAPPCSFASFDVSRAKPDEGYAGKSPPDCEAASWSLPGSLSLLRLVIHGYLRLSPCECPFDFGSISKKAYGGFLAIVMPFFVYSLRWGATVMPSPKETKK